MVLTSKYYNIAKVLLVTKTIKKKENLNFKSLWNHVYFRFNNRELYKLFWF